MTQLFRYVILGLLSNASGYFIYLLITSLGAGPKKAMTGLYLIGATIGFIGNRQWTFSYRGGITSSLARFGIAHLLGYFLNLALLMIFVDRFGYPHEWVQAIAILVVALFLFILFRLFVFPHDEGVAGATV